MGLGAGIFLIALGAILAFAINVDTGGTINLHTVGWILMVVGAVWFVAMLVVYMGRRRTFVQDRQVVPPPADPAYGDPAYGGRTRRRSYEEQTRYDEPL